VSSNVSFNRLPLDDDLRLRDLIVESAHNLEPELRIVGGLLPIGGSKNLDLVGVDGQSRLVLLEARCRENPAWLLEAIDHYDWARGHLEEVLQLYPQHRLDAGRQPRLIFVSAAFSEEFRRRLWYVELLPAEMVEYHYLEVNGVRGLYFEPVTAPAVLPPRQETLQAHLDNLLSSERAAVAERLIARLAALDPGVRLLTHRSGVLALWEERLLARIEFSRTAVHISDEELGGNSDLQRAADIEPVLSRLAARVTRWRRTARHAPARAATRAPTHALRTHHAPTGDLE